jgi:hypothetical protein
MVDEAKEVKTQEIEGPDVQLTDQFGQLLHYMLMHSYDMLHLSIPVDILKDGKPYKIRFEISAETKFPEEKKEEEKKSAGVNINVPTAEFKMKLNN